MTEKNIPTMTSNKPYMLRAMYEWISDNELTPYLYVEVSVGNVILPDTLMSSSPQVLNISSSACQNLSITNEALTFQARFGGVAFDVFLPMSSVIAIVSRENGQGMTFEMLDSDESVSDNSDRDEPDASSQTDTSSKKKKSNLKLIT